MSGFSGRGTDPGGVWEGKNGQADGQTNMQTWMLNGLETEGRGGAQSHQAQCPSPLLLSLTAPWHSPGSIGVMVPPCVLCSSGAGSPPAGRVLPPTSLWGLSRGWQWSWALGGWQLPHPWQSLLPRAVAVQAGQALVVYDVVGCPWHWLHRMGS